MPRLAHRLLWRAHSIDSYLSRLLPVCRELRSARNELRWLREHVDETLKKSSVRSKNDRFRQYVLRRSRGEPLQYIVGSEFFGDLEIKCRPGVLIPRQETALSITHLVKLLLNSSCNRHLLSTLRVLDLCSGSGCIPLLFHHEFYSRPSNETTSLELVGVDVSPTALTLARKNHRIQKSNQELRYSHGMTRARSLANLNFLEGDVLREETSQDPNESPPVMQALINAEQIDQTPTFDILISNPPYISPKDYKHTTSRTVRDFEPKLALVPPQTGSTDCDGDTFYPHLLRIADRIDSKIVLFEVADLDQAKRVATMAMGQGLWDGVEIWRDDPTSRFGTSEEIRIEGRIVPILGSGNGRSVIAYRGVGSVWLGKRNDDSS